MLEKIVELIKKDRVPEEERNHAAEWYMIRKRDIPLAAKEIYALRYDMARELWEEYLEAQKRWYSGEDYPFKEAGYSFSDFPDWIAEQGETITIDLLRRDNK